MFRFSKKALDQGLSCKVKLLLPDEELQISYTNSTTGQDIINEVASEIDLRDRDYYGLKIQNQIQWIDPTKSVTKQTKGSNQVVLELRFKYYPAEPVLLARESTRYYLYLQLKLDLLEGRLRSDDQDTMDFLNACTPDSELDFLKKASELDTYGIDPYPVKEGSSHNHFLIGVNHLGISTFQDSKRTNHFSWDEIKRISLDNKLVLIYCKKTEKNGVKIRPLFGFRCPSQDHAYNFWKIATEHRYFFTLDQTPATPIVTNTGGLFKKSHKLKYTGRVEKDVLRDHGDDSNHKLVRRSLSMTSKSADGSRWHGSQEDKDSCGPMNNIYTSSAINRTMPSSLDCFREEEEDKITENGNQKVDANSRRRPSAGSELRKDSSATQLSNRRSILTTKRDSLADSHLRKDNQFYNCTDQQNHDFIKLTVFLAVALIVTLIIILLIKETDRPEFVNLLVKRMNLEQASRTLRESYFIPTKLALNRILSPLIP